MEGGANEDGSEGAEQLSALTILHYMIMNDGSLFDAPRRLMMILEY